MKVYCKHCGKQITDDSVYCQFCGGKQDVDNSIADNKKERESFTINNLFSLNLSDQKKKILILYIIWVLIHTICWIYGKPVSRSFSPQRLFFPFTSDNGWFSYFNLDYYDSTEFLVYVLLIPLILYFYFKYLHKSFKIQIEKWKKNLNKR